jgi:hypothetical protein
MASEIPVVRNFQACLEVETDPSGIGVTLRTLVHAIARLPGEPFPCIREEMALYALFSNGRGQHNFLVELVRLDHGEERVVGRLGPVRIDLGQDPVAALGLPIPLRNLVFNEAGQYTFYLVCDNQIIADAKISVRRSDGLEREVRCLTSQNACRLNS